MQITPNSVNLFCDKDGCGYGMSRLSIYSIICKRGIPCGIEDKHPHGMPSIVIRLISFGHKRSHPMINDI